MVYAIRPGNLTNAAQAFIDTAKKIFSKPGKGSLEVREDAREASKLMSQEMKFLMHMSIDPERLKDYSAFQQREMLIAGVENFLEASKSEHGYGHGSRSEITNPDPRNDHKFDMLMQAGDYQIKLGFEASYSEDTDASAKPRKKLSKLAHFQIKEILCGEQKLFVNNDERIAESKKRSINLLAPGLREDLKNLSYFHFLNNPDESFVPSTNLSRKLGDQVLGSLISR